MGASGKWFKSLLNLKKPQINEQEKLGDKSKKKWRLWRSACEADGTPMKEMKRGHVDASEAPCYTMLADDGFAAAMAKVARAPSKDFMMVKQQWAAIRIQTFFRRFLARRALRALKAVVRIQAIFRGRKVRKQAAVTLRCMQALVRVQARVRAQSSLLSSQDQSSLDCHEPDTLKLAKKGWCDYTGTVNEVKSKLQMKQEGAIKRGRALAYSMSQQRSKLSGGTNQRRNKPDKNNNTCEFRWLDRWMATKSWDNNPSSNYMTPFSEKIENLIDLHSNISERDCVKVRKNHVSTRISARPRAESLYDEYSASSSSLSGSPTLLSSNNRNEEEEMEEINSSVVSKPPPSYMNLTVSTKAKHRASMYYSSPNRDSKSSSSTSSGNSDHSVQSWRRSDRVRGH